MQSFPLYLTMKKLFPTQVYRPKKTLEVNLFPHIVIFVSLLVESSHLKKFFVSIDRGTGAPSSFPRGSQVRITASFPSQIKLFPIPNMAASITQQAIKLEEKSKYCLKRTSAASKLTRFMAKFDPQPPSLIHVAINITGRQPSDQEP